MTSIARQQSSTAAYHNYTTQLFQIRRLTEARHIDLAQPVRPSQIDALKDNLTAQRTLIANHMGINGIERAAKQEEGAAFDLTVNHTALLVEIDAVLIEIDKIAVITISPAETAALNVKLGLLRAEITVA